MKSESMGEQKRKAAKKRKKACEGVGGGVTLRETTCTVGERRREIMCVCWREKKWRQLCFFHFYFFLAVEEEMEQHGLKHFCVLFILFNILG